MEQTRMPKFYFHLRRGRELVPDEHGDILADVETAYLHAFAAAKELWTLTLARRDDPTSYCFEVTDEQGRFIFQLPLAEVLESSRKGHKRVTPTEVRKLLERNRLLHESLIEQIKRTRSSIDRTYDLLRTLRERE
jgi:hypothetical protein